MKYLKKILFPLVCAIMVGCSESGYVPAVTNPAINTQTGVVNNGINTGYAPNSGVNGQTIGQAIQNANGINTNGTGGNCGCACGQQQQMLQPVMPFNPYLYSYRYQTNPSFYVWAYASGNCVPSRSVVVSACGQTANTGCSACAQQSACANSGCSACAQQRTTCNSGCSACSPQSACANSGCSACAQQRTACNSGCSACANANTGCSACAQRTACSGCSKCSACSSCNQRKKKNYTYNQESPCGTNPVVDSTNKFVSDGTDDDTAPSTSNKATKLKISIVKNDARALYERLAITPNDQSSGVTLRIGASYKCWVEGDGSNEDDYGCDLVIAFDDGSVGLPKHDQAGQPGTAEITNQGFVGSNVQVGTNSIGLDEASLKIGDQNGLASYIFNKLPGTDANKIGNNIKCYTLSDKTHECQMRFQVAGGNAETANR